MRDAKTLKPTKPEGPKYLVKHEQPNRALRRRLTRIIEAEMRKAKEQKPDVQPNKSAKPRKHGKRNRNKNKVQHPDDTLGGPEGAGGAAEGASGAAGA